MDDEPELDEDDIDALCVIEQVEEGSQQRYLLRGLSLIELNQSQIIDFVRIIGKKFASNDPEKALVGSLMLSSLCANLWTRLTITMYSRVLVRQILEWIPKVRIHNWSATINRPFADALYHLSRFSPCMQGSAPRYIINECQRMLSSQNLTVCGQTLILEIFIRFGIPYIFELDVSKLHAIIGLGPEFHFYISARNSRLPPRYQADPRARRAYLDFGNTWFQFLSVYYYRALNVIDIDEQSSTTINQSKPKLPSELLRSSLFPGYKDCDEPKPKQMKRDICSTLADSCAFPWPLSYINNKHKSVRPSHLYCCPNTNRLVDFDFLQSICQSEYFPPLCLPLERIRRVWFDANNHTNTAPKTSSPVSNSTQKTSPTKLPDTISKTKTITMDFESHQEPSTLDAKVNYVVRQLSAGLPVDVIAMLGGLPFCARSFDDTKEGSSTAAAEGEQQTATDKDAIRLRKEEVTIWMKTLFERNEQQRNISEKPKLNDLFDIELETAYRLPVNAGDDCKKREIFERRCLEILKMYGRKTTNWRRRLWIHPSSSDHSSSPHSSLSPTVESLICLSECMI